jgi:osmoprotectant transport system permease protein
LEGRIDAGAMAAMNARAKIDGVPAARVAAGFLEAELGLAAAPPEPAAGLLERVAVRTGEHLVLVAISLGGAVALGIPLGIVGRFRPALGQAVLAVTGVIQTIPALALLVFMIPLFGIGGVPAVAALFLYSLLPIVRNTYTGLWGIPAELRLSAEALGLPAWARLRRVELPLAAPTILAGIKTSAVINIGTATLGALIGAGGYGQPILTGIRLDDMGLILEGAVPAAVLALLAQGVFELAQRRALPRGMR